MLAKARNSFKEYNRVPPRAVKSKVQDYLLRLIRRSDAESAKVRQRYEKYYDKTIRHRKKFTAGDCVFIDKPPVMTRSGQEKSQ